MKKLGKNVDFHRGQWRARIVIPPELRPFILKKDGTPRTALEERLGADPKLAEKRSHAVLADFHDQLDRARAMFESSKPTLATAAKGAFKAELEFDLKERALKDRVVFDEAQRIYADKLRLVAAGLLTGAEAEALIGYAVDDLIAKGQASARTTTERSNLLKTLASVRIDAIAVSQSRDKGDAYPPDPRTRELLEPDPQPLPVQSNRSQTKSSNGLRLSDVLDRFHQERTGGAEKTRTEQKVAIRMLTGFLGEDLPIRSISRADMIAYKDALRITPSNCQQRFPGMTILQAGKANGRRETPYPTLNPTTINDKWLMHINVIFNWAAANDLIEMNPAKGVKVDTGKGFKEPTRVPFSNDDLRAIFSDPFFAEATAFEDRHWAILLALYTGARSSSEIRRIKLSDIYEEQGIPVVHLVEASKNIQSKRLVPIHKDLLELGFMERVKTLRSQGEHLLFPTWDPDDKINRWFLRTYKKKVGINDNRKVFHSFLYNLKTALARCGVNRDISDLITGHKDQSVGGIYISQQALTMVQAMRDGLDRVDFGVRGYFGR